VRVVLAVVGLLVAARGPALAAASTWPPAAQARYEEARGLMQHGRYTEAATAYRSVADWPDGGAFRERAQALYLCGTMQEAARDYAAAVTTYRETARRFADDPFARKAADAASALEEGGPVRGIEFRSRLDGAWDVLSPAQETAERDGPAAARPELERAATLLAGILHDFADHPRARNVAFALGDAHMALGRYADARADYGRAVELARREAERPGADARYAESDVKSAEEKLAEAGRALWRARVVQLAEGLLVAIGLGVIAVRPWRGLDARLLRLGGALVAATGVLAALALGVAAWVQRFDEHSPIEGGVAALFVLLPGLAGQLVALGFVSGLAASGKSSRRAGVAAILGALAALAVATCLVQRFDLFSALDSEF